MSHYELGIKVKRIKNLHSRKYFREELPTVSSLIYNKKNVKVKLKKKKNKIFKEGCQWLTIFKFKTNLKLQFNITVLVLNESCLMM